MHDHDLPDRLGDLIRYGRIASVDFKAGRITVALGDVETQPIRWATGGSGDTRVWTRPKVGEQVMVLSPDGDIAGAIAMRGLDCDSFPPIGDPDRELVQFSDGAVVAYNPDTHALEAVLPDGATVAITAPGGVTLVADVRIKGNLDVDGDVRARTVTGDTDVVGAGKSLKGHKHVGVAAGSAVSGVPQ